MEFKTYIEDPKTPVCLQVHLSSGGKLFASMPVEHARIAIIAWKKYVLYASISAEKREGMDIPFFFYHFLEGDLERPETLTPRLSFLFQNVLAMQYDEFDMKEENERKDLLKRSVKATEKMVEVAEKQTDDIDKGDEWKNESEDK